MVHGFVTLEVAGGFMIDTAVDDSFTWMVNVVDQCLHSARAASDPRDADGILSDGMQGNRAE